MSAWPTEEAREAVTHMSCVNIGCPGPHDPRHGPDGPRIARKKADRILDALAPHVAALVRAERAAAWDEGAEAALDHAVRNADGITLRLDRPNPYAADPEERADG